MANPAKVKISVESLNPTVAFYKDGTASVQSSLVNVGNEFKMKKYIQLIHIQLAVILSF